MTFKRYFLREAPDWAFTSTGKAIGWWAGEAHCFGWLTALSGVEPFLIYGVKPATKNHFDLIRAFFLAFTGSSQMWSHDTLPADVLESFHLETFRTVPAFPQLLQTVFSNKRLYKTMIDGSLYHNLEQQIPYSDDYSSEEGAKKNTGAAILVAAEAFTRTKILQKAGRIWKKSKVISFWNTIDQLTPATIEQVFEAFKIPNQDRENFLIDAIDPSQIEKEGTREKVLPSYSEFKNRKSSNKPLSKDTQKKVADLLSKQHGQAGAQKAKLGKEIPPVGAERYAQKAPLDVRQKTMTSESLKY